MIALRMRQKEVEFYFVSYPAEDLLRKVRFVTRFYGERGEAVGGERGREPDEVEKFITAIEGSSKAFQRELNRKKVRQIRDFFRNETAQPLIPGAILLFTAEELAFHPIGEYALVGDLPEPRQEFLVVDGQHRLAGLHFYLRESDSDRRLEVPCVIFDGKTSEFATEMFVIINSTHTRINKSHLVDLYEKIEWGTDPRKKFAARIVQALYEEADSPLRYHINMLGGRSRQDLWINQAQLFGEVHRLICRDEVAPFLTDGRGWSRERGYGFLRDALRASGAAFSEGWGDNKRFMVTRDVTIKALVRVAGDAALSWGGKELEPGGEQARILEERFARLKEHLREFRRDGFYERFPARGQAERVETIRRRLDRALGISPREKGKNGEEE